NYLSHKDYQNHVIKYLNKLYLGGLLTLLSKDWIHIYKLWITDISGVYNLLIDSYSSKGPCDYNPVNMLRAYLLFLFAKPTIGITKWVDELRRVPLYAIICGFKPNKTPSVGTFYDFFDRLWLGQKDNAHGHVKPKKRKKSKKKKPKKGKKAPVKKKGRVQRLIDRALNYGTYKTDKDTDRLFDLLQSQFRKLKLL
ncbi:MAG: transposase, partial [Bacillota bacterium]